MRDKQNYRRLKIKKKENLKHRSLDKYNKKKYQKLRSMVSFQMKSKENVIAKVNVNLNYVFVLM